MEALAAELQRLESANWDQPNQPLGSTPIDIGWLADESDQQAEGLGHAIGGFLVVFLFPIFERDEHWPHHAHEDRYFTTTGRDRFLAFRHIRDSIAHARHGVRTALHAAEFDRVMASPSRLLGVVDWDEDSIRLSPAIGRECLATMIQVTDHAGKIVRHETQQPT